MANTLLSLAFEFFRRNPDVSAAAHSCCCFCCEEGIEEEGGGALEPKEGGAKVRGPRLPTAKSPAVSDITNTLASWGMRMARLFPCLNVSA